MKNGGSPEETGPDENISRKEFFLQTGRIVTGTIVYFSFLSETSRAEDAQDVQTKLTMTEEERARILASDGYLLVDPKKCQGCMTCMLACSLVHEGEVNLSLSRIQILQNSFSEYPDDLSIEPCRQCISPTCLEACPTGALHIDRKNGNVRRVDEEKCIGCMACVYACAFEPSRAIWNHRKNRSMTCDLCADTPFWEVEGGPGGRQACLSVCPVGAIRFTGDIPVQQGNAGYDVNLRGRGWKKIGYPTD